MMLTYSHLHFWTKEKCHVHHPPPMLLIFLRLCWMTNLMKLRSDYKDAFVEKHGVKLRLMPGFVKAVVTGIQNQPIINAVIDGGDIIYREYIDISIAVGTPKGLVVLVICDADRMNFADIEKEINTLAKKANDGTISTDEMAGGLFMLWNGGVYGCILSTSIINPPQLCWMVRDMYLIVRKEAFIALGKVRLVSEGILLQSLFKKMLGSKNGGNSPTECIIKDSKCQLSCAAGAFLHGVEDEFHEFADNALNLLMDMLNDDVTSVRLQSLQTHDRLMV